MALLNLLLRTRVCIITTSTNAELAAIKQGLFIAQIMVTTTLFFSTTLKTVTALFFFSIATLPRYVLSKLCCSIEYLGQLGELMVNPRTFFGFYCKDWGTCSDLSINGYSHHA
ncbi:hypothetical protein JHK85_018704 [Glycine max]|nr:hypothetical protein JHK85_018704 [Glycine max]